MRKGKPLREVMRIGVALGRLADEMAEDIFKYNYADFGLSSSFGKSQIQVTKIDDHFDIELPRLSIVATGSKA